MKNLIKVFVLTFFFCAASVSYTQAVITGLVGTVEVRHAGSDEWDAAYEGLVLWEDTVVSTGFRSVAVIQAGSSVITVRPLTRLTFAQISATDMVETVNVNLRTGRVRVDVKPPAGIRASVTMRTPVAASSVRGTSFEFDTLNLAVNEGTVGFGGVESAAHILIDAGCFSFIDEQTGRAAPLEETAIIDLRPEPPIGSQAAIPLEITIADTASTADAAENIAEDNTVEFGAGVTF